MKTNIDVVLVNPLSRSNRTAEETLSIGYLASVLRLKRYTVRIIDCWLRKYEANTLVENIQKINPSVLCISCYRSNLIEVAKIVSLMKSVCPETHLICGGYGPTFYELDFLRIGFDVVVRGEAEHIITDLIRRLIGGMDLSVVPGITFLEDGRVHRIPNKGILMDLDDIPIPSRDETTLSISLGNPVHLSTSRGCNGHCSFCSVFSFILGQPGNTRWRQRSIPNIVDEIQYLCDEFGATHFKIVDDSFLEPPRGEKWSHDFENELTKKNLKIKFRTQIRADRLTDVIATNLSKCGWFATSIGIENFSNSALRRMKKSQTSEQNHQALEILHRNQVYTQVGLILFDPNTTISELEENYEGLCRYPWITTKGIFTEMFAAEGTTFTQKLLKTGLLIKDDKNQNHSYFIKNREARRVYCILKQWHKAHADVYDCVIDPLTAPKVMSDHGYHSVHKLSCIMLARDLLTMRLTLDHVESQSQDSDETFVKILTEESQDLYEQLKRRIDIIYSQEGLKYTGVLNPFL